MSASPEELIAINSLLIEREAAYARVHSLEQQIGNLLGAEYPFEAPRVALPSMNKKKVAKAEKATKKASKLKIRRLAKNESGYRLTWSNHGETKQQTVADIKQIAKLLDDPLPSMRLNRVETIDLDGQTIEVIYERSEVG